MAELPGTAPRLAALRAVLEVLDGRALEAGRIDSEGRLEPRDRALAVELSFGVCRWFRRLETLVDAHLRSPLKKKDRDLRVLLLLGMYQLHFSRIPPHAAIAASVECARALRKKWAAGLVNAVLRAGQRAQAGPASALPPGVRCAQPDWLVERLRTDWPAHWEGILDALQQRPPMTLRVDLSRQTRDAARAALAAAGMAAQAVPGVPSALVLDGAVAVHDLPGFAAGLLSVQDAGAQLAAPLLDVQPGQRILDACAAPGGKTLHILEQADGLSVTALDVDAGRLQRVRENLDRGGRQAHLYPADATHPAGQPWAAAAYDRILLDAPCSATGVMRRHPDIRLLRRPGDSDGLGRRQAAILDALWPLLAAGGKFLYVTCSLLAQENQHQVLEFMRRNPDAKRVELSDDWGIGLAVGRQTLPGQSSMDGFYYALLEKPC